MRGRAQKVCLQSSGGVKKVFNPYFPHLPTPPLPINNDHSLMLQNTFIVMNTRDAREHQVSRYYLKKILI
jgi:hypothetical protein